MKISLIPIFVSCLFCSSVFAEKSVNYSENINNVSIEEEYRITGMTTENVISLLSTCKEYALEEEVKQEELNSNLLQCINNMLNEIGYKSIESIPVIKE